MYIHKEGFSLLTISTLGFVAINTLLYVLLPDADILRWTIGSISFALFVIVLQFFRNPTRTIAVADDNILYAPADGKVVVIEQAAESEYFNGEKRLQVSIFMSPINVHVNRNPIGGTVNYFKYHPGKYLVAWHPKASTENERTTVVYQNANGAEVLMRQIAGALAKRIVWYVDTGAKVVQGNDMGFIKFGSRVDLYLPLDAKIEVNLDQKVQGNKTIIARLS